MKVNKKIVDEGLKQGDLVPQTVCGVCGGKLEEFEDFDRDLEIRFSRCPVCGVVTYNKVATQEYLYHMYSNYNDAYDNPGENESVTFAQPDRIARHIFKYIKKYLAKKTEFKIMDFGGGSGVMGYKLAQTLVSNGMCKKVSVTVVDYLDALYKTDDPVVFMEWVFPVHDVETADYDVIIASAIIEHLPKPSDEMKALFDRLAVDGFLYCRMPYAYPMFSLAKKIGIDFDMLYPGHIWDFPPEWFENVIKFVSDPDHVSLVVSQPSIPETTLNSHFIRALVTRMFKAPWYVFHKWPFVGGWEAIYRKI